MIIDESSGGDSFFEFRALFLEGGQLHDREVETGKIALTAGQFQDLLKIEYISRKTNIDGSLQTEFAIGHQAKHQLANTFSKLVLFVVGRNRMVFFVRFGWLVMVDGSKKGLEHLITILKLENKEIRKYR